MVEYTVETLVHLYDSLNDQIDKLQADISQVNITGFEYPDSKTQKTFENAYKGLIKRSEKLIKMRANVEELLEKILEVEIKEAK